MRKIEESGHRSRDRPGSFGPTLLLAASLMAAPVLPGADRLLSGPDPFGRGLPAGAICVDDFNRDGMPDAAAALPSLGWVAVLLGGRPDLLGEPIVLDVGLSPVHVTSGDLDGDSFPDLISVNSGSASASLLFGRAAGVFSLARNLPVGPAPRMGRLADVDNDGDLDIVAISMLSSTGGSFAVLLGDGRGSFDPAEQHDIGDNAHSLVVEDFDGDGVRDVAASHWPQGARGEVTLFRGRGGGAYEPPVGTPLADGDIPRFTEAADLSGGGSPEVVVLTDRGSLLVLGYQTGGTFDIREAGVDPGAAGFAIGDLDRDGRLDLVAAVPGNPSTLLVHPGLGGGAFGSAIPFGLFSFRPAALQLADLDGDSFPEAVLCSMVAERGGIGVVRGGPALLPGRVYPVGSASAVRDIAAWSGGFLVLGANALRRIEDGPDGSTEARLSAELPWKKLGRLAVADLDGDGAEDAAATDLLEGEAVLVFLDRQGNVLRAIGRDAGTFPSAIAAADLDLDGQVDLAVGHQSGATVALIFRPGSADPPETVQLDVGAAHTPVAASDLDGDGAGDIAIGAADGLRLYLGHGDGSFSRSIRLEALAEAAALVTGDFDGDGGDDIVASAAGGLRLVSEIGRSEIPIVDEIFPMSDVVALAAGDIDGDFRLDLAAVEGWDAIAFRGLPGGGIGYPQRSLAGTSLRAAALADLDGDGALDLAAADGGAGSVRVLRGIPRPGPTFRRGDANLDGRVDLTDASVVLQGLFLGAGEPPCLDSADFDDSGSIDLTDPVFLLQSLFLGIGQVPQPKSACGFDPTDDRLGCAEPPACGR
jgi:hypothetical protein